MNTIELLQVHSRDGYAAALAGLPASTNPWKPGTVGGKAWAVGWDVGRSARPPCRLIRLVAVLSVVLRFRGRP